MSVQHIIDLEPATVGQRIRRHLMNEKKVFSLVESPLGLRHIWIGNIDGGEQIAELLDHSNYVLQASGVLADLSHNVPHFAGRSEVRGSRWLVIQSDANHVESDVVELIRLYQEHLGLGLDVEPRADNPEAMAREYLKQSGLETESEWNFEKFRHCTSLGTWSLRQPYDGPLADETLELWLHTRTKSAPLATLVDIDLTALEHGEASPGHRLSTLIEVFRLIQEREELLAR